MRGMLYVDELSQILAASPALPHPRDERVLVGRLSRSAGRPRTPEAKYLGTFLWPPQPPR